MPTLNCYITNHPFEISEHDYQYMIDRYGSEADFGDCVCKLHSKESLIKSTKEIIKELNLSYIIEAVDVDKVPIMERIQ